MIYYKKNYGIYLNATSPINIALVKYWGKLHEDHIIPCNSSLSLTINKQELQSKTKIILLDDTSTID